MLVRSINTISQFFWRYLIEGQIVNIFDKNGGALQFLILNQNIIIKKMLVAESLSTLVVGSIMNNWNYKSAKVGELPSMKIDSISENAFQNMLRHLVIIIQSILIIIMQKKLDLMMS